MPDITVYETNRFARALAKLSSSHQCLVEDEIDNIIADPFVGDQKKGDLSHLWVHKFKIDNHDWLLGYNWNNAELIIHLLQLGSHENYYKDARKKRNVKEKTETIHLSMTGADALFATLENPPVANAKIKKAAKHHGETVNIRHH